MRCNCNTGQRMWDLMAVFHAVLGDELFALSERGSMELTPNAETIFTANPNGNFRYQLPRDTAWANAMLEGIRHTTMTN